MVCFFVRRAEWEQSLGQITPPQPVQDGVTGAEQRTAKPRRESLAQRSQGVAPRRRADSPCSSEQGDIGVPFDGRHILELHGLRSADTATHLEAFLADISNGPIDPVVRLASPPMNFH